MRPFAVAALAVALAAGHVVGLGLLTAAREEIERATERLAVLPPALLKVTSFGFHDLASDVIFSNTLSFYGGKLNRREPLDAETWKAIYLRLDAASALDPYFVDPYYFGQAVLTWAAGMPREANALLDRGRRVRTDDWVLPFFMGFNSFYFLHDDAEAARYLADSSRRPGSPPLVGLLAARLASKSGATQTAIGLLHQLEQQTQDEGTLAEVRRRRAALEGVLALERAVAVYQERFGGRPQALEDLVRRGVLKSLPRDPYGGEYYLKPDGSVWTTSDLRAAKR